MIHKYMVMQYIYIYVCVLLLLFRKPSISVALAPLCNKNPCYLPTSIRWCTRTKTASIQRKQSPKKFHL